MNESPIVTQPTVTGVVPLVARSGEPPEELRSLQRGTNLGRYVILDELGAGGMGVVYRAYDPDLHRRVAVKVLRSGEGTEGSARLLREAQAMAQLSHPNVVTVHDVGTVDETQVYIAMEQVEGQTLTDWQEQERPWAEILAAYVQAGRGLAAAHARELVHRDFKPDNAMIDDAGRVRVMDFGLARAWSGPGQLVAGSLLGGDGGVTHPNDTPLHSQMTREGEIMGTPAYMAPEQFEGGRSDARTDQFSFCVALWEALHRTRPFAGKQITELFAAVTEGRIVEPGPSRLPAGVDRALRRGLSPEPDDRWPNLEALLAELGRHRGRKRGGAVVVLATVGLVAGAGALAFMQDDRCTGSADALAEIWNEGRASAIATQFETAGGAEVWARERERVDAWANAWVAAHEEACQASAVRREQSAETMELRMGCLRRARIGLDAALEVLAEADAPTVQRAEHVVGGLSPVARCEDVVALSKGVEEPPADLAEPVAAVRQMIAKSFALLRAAHHEDAFAVAAEAEAAALEVGYEPALTDALLAKEAALSRIGKTDAALATAKQAQRVAARNGQWGAFVIAASRVVYLLAQGKAQVDEAIHVAELALGVAEYAGKLDAQARLHNALGASLAQAGRYDEAEQAYARSLALWEAHPQADDERIATAMVNLAGAKYRLGQMEEALDVQEEALALLIGELGRDHPTVASAHYNLAAMLNELERHDEAQTHYRRSLDIRVAALPPTHPDVMAAKSGMGVVMAEQGRLDEAQALFDEALAGLQAELGPTHPETAHARCNVAEILLQRDKPAEAETFAARARDDLEAKLGKDHPYVARAADLVKKARAAQDNALAK